MNPALSLFAFLDVGGPEVLVILVITLMLFGGQRLPELAKGLGKSIREFKKAASDVEQEFKRAVEEAPEPVKPAPSIAPPGAQPSARISAEISPTSAHERNAF